ncbi:hypothetical protein [Halopseudomonas salina]|uniref:DnrO protein n=1 Tax=Halopseudomonas salina TaxID=1323744 RepID=A0ABQ1PSM8_9GAMM|nr:hypothetical protein [Halopseudomonas salina]GGD02645.1 hypothetical protein GCM10007418_22310 [Halopseudomonas salina]
MPNHTLGLCLAIVITALPLSLSHAEDNAGAHAHGGETHQQQSERPNALQLNNGNQWQTDGPLRKAMARLRNDLQPLALDIHQRRLSVDHYDAIAASVNDQVTYMIDNCELEAQADAQLHVIIAELMAGVVLMQGDKHGQARSDGAIRVVEALNSYATYFNDPTFEKLDH